MANVVKILRSTTASAVPSSLASGQIAINEKDGKIFWLDTTTGLVVSATLKDLDTVIAAKVSQTGATGAASLPAGTTAQRPTGAAGQLRYNSTTGKFEGFAAAWGNIGGGATISDTAPSNPGAGDLWWNSADGILYVYYNDGNTSQWVATDAGGEGQYVAYTDTGTVTATMLANSAVTQAKLAANVAGNGPAFSAYLSSNQTGVTTQTFTKVNLNAELYDTNNNFDTSTYKFMPTVAGYYFICGSVSFEGTASTARYFTSIYKNSLAYVRGNDVSYSASSGSNGVQSVVSGLVYLNGSTDYVELYAWVQGTTIQFSSGSLVTYLHGYLARAA